MPAAGCEDLFLGTLLRECLKWARRDVLAIS